MKTNQNQNGMMSKLRQELSGNRTNKRSGALARQVAISLLLALLMSVVVSCGGGDWEGIPAGGGDCWTRIGPYATQDTAWERWREASAQGIEVSQGVVPCYDETWTRGYCFNAFHPCG